MKKLVILTGGIMKKIFLLCILICVKAFSCQPPQEYKRGYITTSDGIYYVVSSYSREISRKQLSVKQKKKFTVLNGDSKVAYDGKKIYLEGNYEEKKAPLYTSKLRDTKNSIYGADFATLEVVYIPKFYYEKGISVHKDKNNIYFDYWKKDISNVDIKSFTVVEKFNEEFVGGMRTSYSIPNALIGIFFKDEKYVYYKDSVLEDSDAEKTIDILKTFDGNREGYLSGLHSFYICNYVPDTQAYSSNNNNIYYKNKKIQNADKDSFIIEEKNVFYSRDKNTVYFMGEKQEGIDADTFEILDYDYVKDQGHVYYQNTVINNADSLSFSVLKTDYAKDKNYVYHKNQILDGANAGSYVVLNDDYTKDKNSVYFKSSKIESSDPKTFIIMKYGYSKDKNFAYKDGERILGANGADFIEIKEIYGRVYHKDKKNVYLNGVKIEGADPKTFIVIDHEYSQDKNNTYNEGKNIGKRDYGTFKHTGYKFTEDKNKVYYDDEEIKEIDRKYFEIVDNPYYRDKKYIYYKTQRVEGADPESFRIIEDSKYYDHDYYRDSNYVFFGGKILDGVNPDIFKRMGKYTFYYSDGTHLYYDGVRMDSIDYETFVIYDGISYSKDKNHVYFENKVLEDADPLTFREMRSKKNGRYVIDKNHVYDTGGNINKNMKVEDLEEEE